MVEGCNHPECKAAGTHARHGFVFCLRHFMWVLQLEQVAAREDEGAA